MTNGDVDHELEGQLRQACAELDRCLRAGEPCAAESFFIHFPVLAGCADTAVELIYTEFFTLEELGRAPAPETYYDRFPRWRAQLQEQFQIHALTAANSQSQVPILPARQRSPLLARADSEERSLGTYELLEEIARGAMGVVYKARHRFLNRTVALKMILAGQHAGQSELRRFRTEAEAVARLQHPHIVQIYEVGENAGRPFLALEYVAGGSLAQKLDGKPQPADDAAALIATLARAIHYAHEQGILHRDLKPANILLQIADCRAQIENHINPHGDKSAIFDLQSAIPKITDFGLAKLLDRSGAQSETGALCGTPGYMAPEQAACRKAGVGPAVDTYALGAILYELLTGRPPFKAESLLQTLTHIVSRDPVPPERLRRGLQRDLAVICSKCLQKEPKRRYASAALLADDLDRFRNGEPIAARPITNSERFRRWLKRRPAVAALLLALMLSIITLVGGDLWYTSRLRRAATETDYERAHARVAARDAERQRDETEAAVREARLRQSQAQAASEEARRQKTEATRQIELARGQSDHSRRLSFSIQLAQIADVWKSNPANALRLLMDEERCPRDLRNFAWGMYRDLCTQDRALPSGYSHGVRAVAISPDGRSLAIAGAEESMVRLWDLSQKRERVVLKGHSGRVHALAFAPDSRLLATAGEDRTVRLWFTDTGKKFVTLRGHDAAVTSVAFARNGKTLASGSIDRTARQWDVASGQELLTLRGHTEAVRSVAFAPDGEILASGSDDNTVRFWDLLTLAADKERNVLKLDQQGAITCIAFSPDGKKLAVAGARRAAVDLFDMESYSLKISLRGHVDRIHALSFSPDGRMLASGSEDRTVRLWEVDSGAQRLALQGHAGAVRSVAFAADNQTLASAGNDKDVRLWAIGVRADFQRNNPDFVHAWTGRLITMAYSPDGNVLATGDHDGVLKLSDARNRKILATLPGHGGAIWSITFSPDSRTIATCAEDGRVKLWNVVAGRKLVTLVGPGRPVRAVAFSPNGEVLATGCADGNIKLWHAANRRQQGVLSNHDSEIFALGFSPNGETLAAGCQDGKVRLFDVRTRAKRATLAKHQSAVLFTLFSPDGKTLVTGGLDNTVQLWDTRTLAPRATLLWHAGYVFSAAFTPDSKSLATGGGSRAGSHLPGEVKIWDVSTGQCHATLPGQTGPVAFSPTGNDLATASNYVGVKTWHATYD